MKQYQSKKPQIPHVQDVNFIYKSNGYIKGYSVNTFHGMAKNYNEDRVSIIMNISKPNYKGRWPKCSYFAVFDGHGGNICSDFLKDNMHKYITQNEHFPHRPIQALKQGFKNAQIQFLKLAQSKNPVQRSGSCAIVLLIIDQTCYVANVGDSRAILSTRSGKHVYSISRDHKPDSQTQKQRIFQAGGNIYQSSIKSKTGNTIYGPYRIQPGKLSVSRSFGDIEAKKIQYGGNPKVLIAKPQITYFNIDEKQHDFIMMGSDGIFDKMQNQQIIKEVWNLQHQSLINNINNITKTNKNHHQNNKNHHQNNYNNHQHNNYNFIGKAASRIITKAMQHTSLDNLTTLLIVFEDNGKLLQIQNCQNNYVNNNLISNYNSNSKTNLNKLSNNVKEQRAKSIAYNMKKEDQMEKNQGEFMLKREISKKRLNQSGKNDIKEKEVKFIISKQRQRQRQQDSINTNSGTRQPNQVSLDKLITRKRSAHNFKNQQQNQQNIGNLPSSRQQPSHYNYSSKPLSSYNNTISSQYKNQFKQPKSSTSIISDGEIKKKLGLMRKDSKKESVWMMISKGVKSSVEKGEKGEKEKIIEKIRY